MKHRILNGIEEAVAVYGIIKEHTRNPDHRVEWKVTCRGDGCGRGLVMHWPPNVPPEIMLRDVQRKGWQIGRGDRPLCAICQKAIKRKAKELDKPKPKQKPPPLIPITTEQLNEAAMQIAHMFPQGPGPTEHFKDEGPAEAWEEAQRILDQPDPPPSMPPQQEPPVMTISSPSPAETQVSPRIARLLHELLGEFFDENAGAYRHGYSDERIAAEVGCHIGVVQRTRGEGYGDLIEDTRISALREDLSRLERALEKIEKTARADIDALRSRLEQIAQTTKSR